MSGSRRRLRDTPERPCPTPQPPTRLSGHLQGTKQSYEGFLRSVSVEDLAARCAALVQEMGWIEPLSKDKKRAILREVYNRHADAKWQRKRQRHSDAASRRRARKMQATIGNVRRGEIIARDNSTCYLCGK